MATVKASPYYNGTGRRKSSTARVFIKPGTGSIIVNGKKLEEYFSLDTAILVVNQPLKVLDVADKYDVKVTVRGGGSTGQAGAICLGLSRALVAADEVDGKKEPGLNEDGEPKTVRGKLRKHKLLTRDARAVERKKFGFRKARKKVQFSKR